jgi:hypothetical protein
MNKKPIIILFNGFNTPKSAWEFNLTEKLTLKKLTFLNNLKKIGNVFTFNYNFFNIGNYFKPINEKDKKVQKKFNKLHDKYNLLLSYDIDFTLEDLDFKNICNKIYNNVIKKYGINKKIIVIGHSYGSHLALLFSKLYKNKCIFCVYIDETYTLEYFNKNIANKYKNLVNKYFDNNIKLKVSLDLIKSNVDPKLINKEINKVYKLFQYKAVQYMIKYYDKKLYVPTLIFKAFISNPKTTYEKESNLDIIKEKKILEKYNCTSQFKYFIMLDAEHFIWNNESYSNMIIDQITQMIKYHHLISS